jgi:imidazole glycerol-phosphate synthase subunit HisF
MYRNRIIPVLLIQNRRLVKSIKFKNHSYIGDPLNAVKIFNEKCADELLIIDINARRKNNIDFNFLRKLANQAFMPLTYSGGISSVDEAKKIFALGFEKICINSSWPGSKNLIEKLVPIFGKQSICVCLDIKTNLFGKKRIYDYISKKTNGVPLDIAKEFEKLGVGELLLQSVDKDGTMSGYDEVLLKDICTELSIPVIALGGAGSLLDIKQAIASKASAAAAGSLFIYYNNDKAVLINYPTEQASELQNDL